MNRRRVSRQPLAGLLALLVVAGACADDAAGPEGDASGDGGATSGNAGCEPSRPADPGTSDETFDHDGVERTYRLTVPAAYDGTGATPIVVNLHGFTSTAEQQDAFSAMPERAGDRGYVVVSPQGLDADIPLGDGVSAPFWNIAPTVDTSGVEETDLGAATTSAS